MVIQNGEAVRLSILWNSQQTAQADYVILYLDKSQQFVQIYR